MKKLNVKKNTNKPEIPGKVKKGYRIYVMAVLALTLTMSMGVTAFAAGNGAAAGDHHGGGGLRLL